MIVILVTQRTDTTKHPLITFKKYTYTKKTTVNLFINKYIFDNSLWKTLKRYNV